MSAPLIHRAQPCTTHHVDPVDPAPTPRFREAPQVPPLDSRYDNAVAEHYAAHGYRDFAALLEAGYACSACHLTHQLNRIPTDEELDLERFAQVAGVMRGARVAVELFTAAFMGAQASLEASLRGSSARIIVKNAADPLDEITVRQVGEAVAADPLARRAYAQLQSHGTEVVFDFGTAPSGTMGIAHRQRNFVVVYMRNHTTVKEAVSTLVHESSHIHRHFRGGVRSQVDEVRAFAREFVYKNRRRPSLAERRDLWRYVEAEYWDYPRIAP